LPFLFNKGCPITYILGSDAIKMYDAGNILAENMPYQCLYFPSKYSDQINFLHKVSTFKDKRYTIIINEQNVPETVKYYYLYKNLFYHNKEYNNAIIVLKKDCFLNELLLSYEIDFIDYTELDRKYYSKFVNYNEEFLLENVKNHITFKYHYIY